MGRLNCTLFVNGSAQPRAQVAPACFLWCLIMTRRRTPRGFTLIELLVVITLIVLLIAILLPTLEKTREIGKRIKCLSGVRQVAIATRSYALDNKEYVPTNGFDLWPLNQVGGWGFQANLVDRS